LFKKLTSFKLILKAIKSHISKTTNTTLCVLHVERYTRPHQRSHANNGDRKSFVYSSYHVTICSHYLIICRKRTVCFHANVVLALAFYNTEQISILAQTVTFAVRYCTVFFMHQELQQQEVGN